MFVLYNYITGGKFAMPPGPFF